MSSEPLLVEPRVFQKTVHHLQRRLKSHPCLYEGNRTEAFEARDLVGYLGHQKLNFLPSVSSEGLAEQFAQLMAQSKVIRRCVLSPETTQMIKANMNPRWVVVDHPNPSTFDTSDELSVYIWQHKPGERVSRIMSFSLVALSASLCFVKMWPLWLKLLAYWTSLTLVITIASLFALRFAMLAVFRGLGIRSVWLFPNLLSDEVSGLEIFRPIIGTGDYKEGARHKQGRALNTGLINFLVIVFLGGSICWSTGLYDASHIPNFIAEKQVLFERYPILARTHFHPNQPLNAEKVESALKHAAEAAFEAVHTAADTVAESLVAIASDDDYVTAATTAGADLTDDADVAFDGPETDQLPPDNEFLRIVA